MNTEEEESCIVCGKSLAGTTGFAHLYHDGKRFAVCCPMCLQVFERFPDRFASGDRPQNLLEELLQQLTWKDQGR